MSIIRVQTRRLVSCDVCLDILGKKKFFNCILRSSLPIQREICDVQSWCQLKDHAFLRARRHWSTKDSQVWVPGPTSRFLYQIPKHLFQMAFGMGQDPEVIGPHAAAYLMCLFTFELQQDGHLFLVQFSITLTKSCVNIFCHNREASTLSWRRHRLKAKLLSTHLSIAFPSSPDISREKAAVNHPCVSEFSIIFATCLGLASSNAVLMSKLAQYIVGRITLPCFNMEALLSCHF